MDNEIKERLKLFLSESRLCVIATVMFDGIPHNTVMHYSSKVDPIELYFSTDDRSTKIQNISTNKNASVVIGWSEDDWITIQMRGNIRIVMEDDKLSHVKTTHYSKHPNSKRFEHDPHTVFLVFIPTWVRFSDLGVEPAIISETSTNM